jgi:hypothetical protein
MDGKERVERVHEARDRLEYAADQLDKKGFAAMSLGMSGMGREFFDMARDIEDATIQMYDCWADEQKDHLCSVQQGSVNMLKTALALDRVLDKATAEKE